jgi:hypothetical protein
MYGVNFAGYLARLISFRAVRIITRQIQIAAPNEWYWNSTMWCIELHASLQRCPQHERPWIKPNKLRPSCSSGKLTYVNYWVKQTEGQRGKIITYRWERSVTLCCATVFSIYSESTKAPDNVKAKHESGGCQSGKHVVKESSWSDTEELSESASL